MHPSADLLALLALGEDVASPEDHHHLAGCRPCQEELTSLQEVVTVGRSLTEDDLLIGPGPEVWERIQAETRAEMSSNGFRAGTGPALTAATTDGPHPPDTPVPGRDDAVDPVRIPAPARRGRRRAAMALVAVIALVAGVAIGLGVNRLSQPTLELVAEIGLAPVSDAWPTASGTARLEETPDGRRELVVQVDPGRPIDSWGEVWLINEDFERMVSLGPLDPRQDRYLVPAGLDVADYPWVDVSAEPDNGQSAHSGDSIARGELPH